MMSRVLRTDTLTFKYTHMVPLLVLIGSFLLLLAVRSLYKELTVERAGSIAFGVMLLFTGSSHFYLTEGMVMSMPPFFPAKETLVYFTGVLEIAFALGLVLGKKKPLVAKLLIAFLVAVFPANVYAALNHIDIENATYTGPGPSYLFFRGPLQLFFIAWVYYFGIRLSRERLARRPLMSVVPGREGRVDVLGAEQEKQPDRQRYWD
jgi:uncharacterized membrane protein